MSRLNAEVLDLFCCQGGATRGYQLAGFKVTGVDQVPQPRYCGDHFVQADAIEYVMTNADQIRQRFALVHASPPCQFGTDCQRIQGNQHPNLIPETRHVLDMLGLPYVIENVEGVAAHLNEPVLLCGQVFGLHTYRHRLFETKGFLLPIPPHPRHLVDTVKMGRPVERGQFYHAVGNFSNVPYVREDMDMPWASRDGLREAIPPVYTRWIGEKWINSMVHSMANEGVLDAEVR
jgi:DNA (cytosine-5)-methyltransferase 1